MTESELEERLRRTLTARADRITADRLQPAVPPTSSVRPGLTHRIRWWMPAVAGAALIAAVVLVRLPGPDAVAPVAPPAPATSTTVPAPSASPSSAAARPVPTTRRGTTTPSGSTRPPAGPRSTSAVPSAVRPTAVPSATRPSASATRSSPTAAN